MTLEDKPAIFRVQLNKFGPSLSKIPRHIEAWHELVEAATEFRFKYSNGDVVVSIDWMGTKDFIVEQESNMIDLDRIKTKEDLDAMITEFEEYRRLKSVGAFNDKPEIEFCIYNSSDEYRNFEYVTNVLYQLFLVMNLSVPGSCDFDSAIIRRFEAEHDTSSREVRLGLSGLTIECSTQLIDKMNWPEIHVIPVRTVMQWLEKIGFSRSNFANSNTERAIFGLLYSCMHKEADPTTLIWLSQAMEALFNTPQVGIANTLKERAFLVLGEPHENLNKVKKDINAFYNYRSRYVHGEILLPNPIAISLVEDEELNKFHNELYQHLELAMILIVASLQKLIMEDSSGFDFSETMSMQEFV
jgi:hypothetical protein